MTSHHLTKVSLAGLTDSHLERVLSESMTARARAALTMLVTIRLDMASSSSPCFPCSCGGDASSVVDLTNEFAAAIGSATPTTTAKQDEDHQLVQALAKVGWCLVSLDVIKLLQAGEDDKVLETLKCHVQWKRQIAELFDNINGATDLPCNLTFHGHESGSSDGTVEPKQSWELVRSSTNTCIDHPKVKQIHEKMQGWIDVLHAMARTVRETMGLPSNVFLSEEEGNKCVDLLRAFYYDTVEPDGTTILGSSPHTDWGSFTVVYQDSVGGLQTYCRARNVWTNVPAPSLPNDNIVQFVVHVGDVTSLVLNHNNSKTPCFPSPRHRVVSPTGSEKRASLVYFAYPPADTSLQDMVAGQLLGQQHARGTEDNSNDQGAMYYEDYSLLMNQSATSGGNDLSCSAAATRQLRKIWTMPLSQVLQDKWQQVQRDY